VKADHEGHKRLAMWFEEALYIASLLYLVWFPFIFIILCAYYFLALVKSSRKKQAKPE
jgi:hypothetical protein